MKRAMLSMAAAVLAGGVAACSPNPPERAANDVMMICVSRAKGNRRLLLDV